MPKSRRLPTDRSEHSQGRRSGEIEGTRFFPREHLEGNRSKSPEQNERQRIPRSLSTRRSFGSTNVRGNSLTGGSSSSLPNNLRTRIDEWRVAAAESKADIHAQTRAGSSIKQRRRSAAEPPRAAREGYEWVWYPEGYWAERDIDTVSKLPAPPSKSKSKFEWMKRSRGRGNGSSTSASEKANNFPSQEQPSSKSSTMQYSPTESDSAKSISAGRLVRSLQQLSPTYPHFISPTGVPEGLYCKTKRGIGVGLLDKQKKEFDQDSILGHLQSPSQTTMTLEGAATYFERLEQETSFSDQTYQKDPSVRSRFSPKRIGLAPWHRSNSHDSSWSVTSSIRDLVRGRTPAGTPSSQMKYSGPDGQDFFKVEISKFTDPTFLPSEARRVNTPPFREATADGKARGFFFHLSPLDHESLSEQSQSPKASVSGSGVEGDAQSLGNREWWDDDISAAALSKERLTTEYDLDVPDHLPNSPLCPTHPKHKSGGIGVCVYHGRRKSSQAVLQYT